MLETGHPAQDVIIHDAAASTQRIQGSPHQVIRGVLLPEYFSSVEVPDYQRAAITHHKQAEIESALHPTEGLGVPDDLLLCVRTSDFKAVGPNRLVIPRAVLQLLDGHQRMHAAWSLQARLQSVDPFGVKIILGTTRAEEVGIFYIVNRRQTKVRTDVHLRNADTNPGIEALKRMLKNNPGLIVVQWDHMKPEGAQMTAHMLYEIAVVLHGQGWRSPIEDIIDGLETTAKRFGTDTMERNVVRFFQVLKQAFGHERLMPYMFRIDVMRALAKLFWDHPAFWDRKNPMKLLVRTDDIRKISGIRPTTVSDSMQRSNAAGDMYNMLVRQVNSGRKTGLTMRSE